MKPARTDVKLIRRDILCKNSTSMGFSSLTLHPGDLFVYQDGDQQRVGKSHGVINTLEKPEKKLIFAQVLYNNLQFSGERWVDPDAVIETIRGDQVNQHLARYFEELAQNHSR